MFIFIIYNKASLLLFEITFSFLKYKMNLYKINYLNLLYNQHLKVSLNKDKNQLNSIVSYRKHYLLYNEKTIIFKIFRLNLRN